jgi:2-dehydropantoate 2-reductase
MKILVYGAGVIGSVYAAFLSGGGHEVEVLARGRRLAEIREHGIRLAAVPSGRRIEAKVEAVEALDPSQDYDLVLVVVPFDRLAPILPVLADHPSCPTIAFIGNNIGGPEPLTAALGEQRVLMGFPDFGGSLVGDRVRFATRTGSDRNLGLTLGELDGRKTARLRHIAEAFGQANVRVEMEPRIDAWLKGHAALVLPILFGLVRHANDSEALARDGATLRQMARAIREGLAVLRAHALPVTPLQLRLILWLPTRATATVLARILASEFAKVAFAGHAAAAGPEFERLWSDFRALAARSGSPVPTLDALHAAAHA